MYSTKRSGETSDEPESTDAGRPQAPRVLTLAPAATATTLVGIGTPKSDESVFPRTFPVMFDNGWQVRVRLILDGHWLRAETVGGIERINPLRTRVRRPCEQTVTWMYADAVRRAMATESAPRAA